MPIVETCRRALERETTWALVTTQCFLRSTTNPAPVKVPLLSPVNGTPILDLILTVYDLAFSKMTSALSPAALAKDGIWRPPKINDSDRKLNFSIYVPL